MELPHLGQNCSETSCKRLDFLPVKCDGCSKIFCNDHYRYESHDCPTAPKSIQIPACPACGAPVPPGQRGEPPDVAVWAHLERACDKNKANQRKAPKCCVSTCKVRELVPLVCDKCGKNHCLKHRYPQDHKCGENGERRSVNNVSNKLNQIQGTMDEDEALARALALSMQEGESDEALARRLQAEEQSRRNAGNRPTATTSATRSADKCNVS